MKSPTRRVIATKLSKNYFVIKLPYYLTDTVTMAGCIFVPETICPFPPRLVAPSISSFYARGVQMPAYLYRPVAATRCPWSSVKRQAPGCVISAGKAKQKWQTAAGTKFTKPWAHLLAETCKVSPDPKNPFCCTPACNIQ